MIYGKGYVHFLRIKTQVINRTLTSVVNGE